MDWILQPKAWLLTLLGIALFLTVLPIVSHLAAFATRMLQRFPRSSPAPRPPANLGSSPSGNMGPTVAAPELAPSSGYRETPTPSTIVADVCSLNSPVRERVEQSYRGVRVRWTLRHFPHDQDHAG